MLLFCAFAGAAIATIGAQACNAGGATTGSSTAGVGGGDFDAGSGAAGGFDEDAACAEASDEAKQVPVNLYIMFDKSGSMVGTKWSQSTAALQAFFSDPASAGLRVALRFFPDTGCDATCNASACAQPKVEAGALTNLSAPTDTHEQALIDAFIDVVPSGGTPLSAALDGALAWANGVLTQSPTEKVVVALVTDGLPEDCQDSDSYFVNAAQAAFDQRGILTFAIGLEGSNESLMDQIAAAGGTEGGLFIGTANAQAELVAALDAIRESSLACEYEVPSLVEGVPVDPQRVNVLYESGPEPASTIGQVANAAACAAAGGGWYYDDPAMPARIIFCPSTCATIRDDPAAKVRLLFGCTTVPA